MKGNSAEGRYVKAAEAQLTEHLGGDLSAPQRWLVARAARTMLRIELLDRKMAEGTATDLDLRTLGALSNQLRLLLKDIGLRPNEPRERAPTLEDIAAEIIAKREPAA